MDISAAANLLQSSPAATTLRPKNARRLSAQALVVAAPGDILWDDMVPGLHARVGATRASYHVYYRTLDGRQRRPKLGDIRVLNLTQAREQARAILARVTLGHDPAGDAKAIREAPDVEAMCARYMLEHASTKKTGTADKGMIDSIVLPRLRHRKVVSLTHDDVYALHASMRGTPYRANRVLSLLSTMLALAERWGWRPKDSNPAHGIGRYKEHKRRRYMRPAEARAIARLLDEYEGEYPRAVGFLRLLILTGARPKEIAQARREWLERFVDDAGVATGVIHHPDAKTGARDIFLSPAAQAVVDRLPRGSDTLTGIGAPEKLWSWIRVEADCPDLRMYDLRHSFASVAISLGMTLAQIGELLGHSNPQTTQRYAHLMDEDKRDAAARIAAATTQRMLPEVSP